jgi:hypothetical protein
MPNESLSQRRPWPVLVAVSCIAVILGITLFVWAFTVHWNKPLAWITYFAFAALFYLFVRALHRGRRWARWLTIWSGAICTLLLPITWLDRPVVTLYVVQDVLLAFAVVLLLLPSSRGWFAASQTAA